MPSYEKNPGSVEPTPIDAEEQIQRLLLQLPEELRALHEERSGELPEEEAISYLQEIIDKRGKAVSLLSTPEAIHTLLGERYLSPESDEYHTLSALVADLKEVGDPVGEGRTAAVISADMFPNSCFKILLTPAELAKADHFTKPLAELELMLALEQFEVEGVRIPKIEGYALVNNAHVIRMERIPGHSLKDIMEHHLPLPEGFDSDAFFNAARTFMEELHERNIYHRDLHAGNIMLDYTTLEPRIIDFGRSIKAAPGTENPYLEFDTKGHGERLKEDLASLATIRKDLEHTLDSF